MPRLDQRGEATVVIIASWLVITAFLGFLWVTVAVSTSSKKTDLEEIQSIHESKDYEKMTPDQKRKYWENFFKNKNNRGG